VFGSGMKNPLNSAILEYKKISTHTWKKIDEIPFDFMRKRDSVILEHDNSRMLLTKGAPEDIMNLSIFCETKKQKFTKREKARAEETYKTLSEQGFRVLGLASKELKKKDEYSKADEEKLTFLGFIAFFDPPKKTAKETLKRLSDYGIGIKIITGDNDLVTKKVAKEINLPITGTLTGAEIHAMTDRELQKKVEETNLFSRVTPDQKTKIIQMLQKNGHVVGYLGDGINDAPSLKAADVSISVNNAVDIAKESADMILMKKSLGDLVDGVREGRKTFMNTMKYLMMELSSNFGNMFSMAGASFFLPFLPMLPAQILLNNMLYDVSQFSLSLDNVDEESIRTPKKMNIGFLKKFMITFGPVSSFFDFLTFGVLYWGFHLSGAGFQTGWFLESLATQTFVVYFIRTKYFPSGKNAPSLPVLLSTIGVVVLGFGVALSFLGSIFGFVAIPIWVLLVITGITLAYLVTIEFVKQMFYKKHAL
jgi:Mg2+-importing ATPase